MSFDVHPILDPGQMPSRGIWYAISPEGSQDECGAPSTASPCPRVGACANFLQVGKNRGKVLVSAGATPEGPYSDLYQLILTRDQMEWEIVPTEGLPPRYEHASFVSHSSSDSNSHTLCVFAGAKPEGPVSDVWKLDLEGRSWKEVKVRGSIPVPRTYHSSSSFVAGRDYLVVVSGGEAGVSSVQDNATYLFNQRSGEWSKPVTSGPPPSPRQGHVAVVVDSKLFIHGGMAGEDIKKDLFCLDLDTWEWSCPKVGGAAPPPLAAHGCAVVGSDVYIFGGLSPAVPGAMDQLYCLDTDLLTWQEIRVLGPPPPARLDHAMCTISIPVTPAETTPTGTRVTPPAQTTPTGTVTTHGTPAETTPTGTVTTHGTPALTTPTGTVTTHGTPALTTPTGTVTTHGTPALTTPTETKTTLPGVTGEVGASSEVKVHEGRDNFEQRGRDGLETTQDGLQTVGCGCGLAEPSESGSKSFCAATVIDSEDVAQSNFSVSESLSEAKVAQVSEEMRRLGVKEGSGCEGGHISENGRGSEDGRGCEWVSALFVFGGMDTAGNIHGDSFIFVP